MFTEMEEMPANAYKQKRDSLDILEAPNSNNKKGCLTK